MGIIGQSNAMHNRFAMGGGFMPMARTPMARPMMSGPIFVMGGFEQPSHCHCGEKAALWGGLIGGGLGILAGLFGRKQQAVQYAPGYGGGYSGGVVQQPLTSAQQLTNLKTLYGDKGYAIVDNGDGTFSATKGGNNIGRGSYEDMQKLLGESNDKTNNSTTAKDNTGTTTVTDGSGAKDKVGGTTTTTVSDDDKKVDDNKKDDTKTGDAAKKDSTTKTDDKSKAGETVTTDDDSSTKPTDGGSKAKGSGSASRAKGTRQVQAKKPQSSQPTKYTSSTGRWAQKGADGKWHYYAKDGTELNENHISKNDPELWAKTNPKYASKKNAIYTTKKGDYATKDDQGRLHYFDKNGKPITEKQFKGTHNTVNTTNVKQGGYSSQKGHRVASKTGRWAEKGQDDKWHYYAKDGTELKGDHISQKDPELWNKTHPQSTTSQMMRDRYKPENYGQ